MRIGVPKDFVKKAVKMLEEYDPYVDEDNIINISGNYDLQKLSTFAFKLLTDAGIPINSINIKHISLSEIYTKVIKHRNEILC